MLLIEAIRAAGWPDAEHGNVLAVISHEDPTGNPAQPSYYNQFGTEDSWGLLQINRMAHPQYSVEQLCDAVFNLQVGRQLWEGAGNYRDWWTTAQLEGLPPFGNASHSTSEFAALASVDVGGGSAPPPGGDGLPFDAKTVAYALLGLAAAVVILDL